ncbi:CPBP family intramembrane glutamic endopeptidase, partial [Klebsiella pneumoniae]|uniref:CPBP family intramembrane glutamic endopeptidase n=3 Tax=Klebsiella pneumoniae TaxID=573 RepID=UPI0039695C05
TLKMPAFEWVHVQLHQQKGMISLSPPTICNSALFADKSIPDVILTLLTIFILAPLNEETLFRGIMLNVFRSRYCWTMWLGALITSLLFVAAHSQYQNLLTLAELFLVGLITSVARIRSGGLLLPVLLHMEATTLGLLFG